jgi:hypothetical protein
MALQEAPTNGVVLMKSLPITPCTCKVLMSLLRLFDVRVEQTWYISYGASTQASPCHLILVKLLVFLVEMYKGIILEYLFCSGSHMAELVM